MPQNRHLHWFRSDLRLSDNPAMSAAAREQTDGLLTCFFICPRQWRAQHMAPVQVEFLRQNLVPLQQELSRRRIPLLIELCDDFQDIPGRLHALMSQHQCQTVHFNQEYGIDERRRDEAAVRSLTEAGWCVRQHQQQAVITPGRLLTKAGTAYTVFTPFRRAWLQELAQFWPTLEVAPAPQPAPRCEASPIPEQIPGFSWPHPIAWAPGEAAAHERLEHFLHQGLLDYAQRRDFPAEDGTSRLSPYLALGVLSARQALMAANQVRDQYPGNGTDIDSWINELIWRDFYIHIFHAFPQVARGQPFRQATTALAWRDDQAGFQAWCAGQTGIPIVDAAMRQLSQTGWMHNRLRMITAMFLSKNLLIDWRWGERYFREQLIDGELALNNGGWQWCASTGTDAAPYFRLFNPITQGRKFDPDGRFVHQYLPELRERPLKRLHQPLSDEERGYYLYPPPIVDLKSSRERVLAAFRALKDQPSPEELETHEARQTYEKLETED